MPALGSFTGLPSAAADLRRRAVLLSLAAATLAALTPAALAQADGGARPICALSTSVLPLLEADQHRIGVAVIELDTGREWHGGDADEFALHSLVKPPIAWLALTRLSNTDAESQSAAKLRRQIDMMVTHSANEPVPPLLEYIGGIETLGEYYEWLGVPEMASGLHPTRWGIGTATALNVARLYAALATSANVSERVRHEGLELLARVPRDLRWGADRPPESLAGWQSLVKTGWYLWRETEVRINSAAIWLDPEGQPRYVIVMMLSGQIEARRAQALQNRIGTVLGRALAERELGPDADRWNCLELSLDVLLARYF